MGANLTRVRRKKVLGLAWGERSILAAEVAAAQQRPELARVAEFVFPEGPAPAPEELGKALGQFLRDNQFSVSAAVIGIPAKWLVVRSKEVPPSDTATVIEMLRLSAEAEFSTELKDLVYDFSGDLDGKSKSVMLVATPKKQLDTIQAVCEAARLHAVVITASAVALGDATEQAMSKNAVVLAVSSTGGEITAQTGSRPSAVKHVRAPAPQPPFLSEIRRALSTMPSTGPGREIVLWDGAGLDSASLGSSLGVSVRNGELPLLGVDTGPASVNGEGSKYAAAVSLALAGIGTVESSIDFLHSRLAPPKQSKVPRWVMFAGGGAVLLLGLIIYACTDLQSHRQLLLDKQSSYDARKDEIAAANAFSQKVSFARGWHGGNPRYLACLRDLTNAIPQDNQTYATSLVLKEVAVKQNGAAAVKPGAAEADSLTGQLYGKTSDQQRVQLLLDQMKRVRTFTDVKLGGSNISGRNGEVSFSVTFNYVPPKAP